MSDFNTFYPEGKKVVIGSEDIYVKPFVLANRTKVLRIIADALLEYSKKNPEVNVKELSEANAVGMLVQSIIEVAGEKLVEIYVLATGKDRDWLLDNVTLKNEVEILTAIQEVNDIPFLFSQVKSLIKSINLQKTSPVK
jgi:hypothetical protein